MSICFYTHFHRDFPFNFESSWVKACYAGGTGAGKTTALDLLESVDPALKRSEMIYDTNMNKFDSADKKIKQATAEKNTKLCKTRLIGFFLDSKHFSPLECTY